jgi:hypothetical protein
MWTKHPLVEDQEVRISHYGHCVLSFINLVRLTSRTKTKFSIAWMSVLPTYQQNSDREKLIGFISELPDGYFLNNVQHIDQIKAWMRYKNHAINIAKCLQAGHGIPDNPLERELREGDISQWRHDGVWFEAKFYEHIWQLCLLKGDKIRKVLTPNYNFDSNLSLCKELIRPHFNSEFSLWMKSYHEENTQDNKKLANLVRKSIKGKANKEDFKNLRAVINNFIGEGDHLLRVIVLECCRNLAKKDSWIESWLKMKEVYCEGAATRIQKEVCDPSFKDEGFGQSWIIREGQAIPKMQGWKA